jgi:hypothetical protein
VCCPPAAAPISPAPAPVITLQQIFECSSYALAQALICRSNERIRVATRTRDALNLVLTTLEIAEDGDNGIQLGLAPALLHAVHSVRSHAVAQFVLTPPRQGGDAAASLWTVVAEREA